MSNHWGGADVPDDVPYMPPIGEFPVYDVNEALKVLKQEGWRIVKLRDWAEYEQVDAEEMILEEL
jgi:hypothetical protein